MSREEMEKKLIEKIWQDEDFKQEFLKDPRSVIAREIGETIPDEIQITVVEEKWNNYYFRIPLNPEELSDDALDAVAGGSSPQPFYKPF